MLATRLGPYEITAELGSGGMGTVYRALALDGAVGVAPGVAVALKVVHPHLLSRPEYVERFRREARLGRSVRHPNVVATYDAQVAAQDEGTAFFLVMEYVVGRTLRALLADLERVPEGLLREIAHQVASGLAAIHAQGIVHRDIKPENVLITEADEVRIMDLGIARALEETHALTETGDFAGSLAYAAPEQFGARPAGTEADLYALGILLYELATGRNPFTREDAAATIQAQLNHVPPTLTHVDEQLSPFLAAVVSELLAKDPARRPPSAAFVRDLFAQGEGSAWWRARRRVRLAPGLARPRVPVPRDTALYGREEELANLRACWERARAGEGQTVFLEGEAGIGKSRLVDAFLQEVAAEDAHILYGAYHPGGGTGGLSAGILDHFAGEDLAGALAPYLADAPALAPAFAAILRHDTPPASVPPVRGDALQALTVYLMRGLAAEKPLLWVVDDLQFAGTDSRKVTLGLARAVEGRRVLLVLAARPGLPEEELAHYDRLPTVKRRVLHRLSPREVMELLRDALRSDAVADRLGGTVAYKSDGVPLFVLEMVRGLKADRFLEQQPDGSYRATRIIEHIEVPSAVRGLISARLSALTTAERAMLDVGAVQGYEFDPVLVASVLGTKRIPVLQALAEIERRSGIVRAAGRSMRFDHHQIQEVLLHALPPALRVEYHAALAEAYVSQAMRGLRSPAELAGEDAVFLATHHLQGARPAEGLPFLQRALDHLEGSYRNEALVALVQSAVAERGLLPPETKVELLLRGAERLGYLGRTEAEQDALREAEQLAQDPAARHLLARVKTRLGWCHVRKARYDEAEIALAEACFLAREAGDAAVESAATENLGVAFYLRARYAEAQRHFARARDLARRAGDLRAEANAVGGMGIVLRARGQHAEARTCHEEHLAMARAAADRRGEMNALGNLGHLLNYQHDYAGSQTTYEHALVVAREIGDRAGQAALQGSLAALLWKQGHLEAALTRFESTLLLDREIGNRDGEARMLLNLAGLWRVLGAADAARRDYEAAHDLCRQIGARLLEGYALLGLASVDRELARYGDAEAYCDEALALFRTIGQREGVAQALEACGRVWAETGRIEDAADRLRASIEATAGRGGAADVALRRCRLAALPGGDVKAAREAFEASRENASVFQQLAMLHLLGRAEGDTASIEAAWNLLQEIRDRAPAAWRDAMIECVRRHREIKADRDRARA